MKMQVSSLLVYTGSWIRQVKFIVLMTKEGSTKIVESMAGVFMVECGHISYYNDYGFSIQHIGCHCIKGI